MRKVFVCQVSWEGSVSYLSFDCGSIQGVQYQETLGVEACKQFKVCCAMDCEVRLACASHLEESLNKQTACLLPRNLLWKLQTNLSPELGTRFCASLLAT